MNSYTSNNIAGLSLALELGARNTAATGLALFRTRLTAANSRREIFEVFTSTLMSTIPIDSAKVLLANDRDWVESYTARKGVENVSRDFEPINAQLAIDHKHDVPAILNTIACYESTEAAMGTPIILGSRCLGVVWVYRERREFDKIELDYLRECSEMMVDALSILDKQTHATFLADCKYSKQLEELNYVGQQLATTRTEKEVFRIVAAAAERILGATRVSYVVPNLECGTCIVFALHGDQTIPANAQIPLPGSALELVMIRNEPCFFENLADSVHPELQQLASHGILSAISLPIYSRGRIVGIFNAAGKKEWSSREEAKNLFAALGRFLESSLQRVRAQKNANATMEQLAHDANHDDLTGLPNRSYFTKTLENEVRSSLLGGKPFALVFIDLDDFKKVNDTLSHVVGDQLLIQAGQRMLGEVRPNDIVARLGGDEFVVLLRNVNGQQHASTLANRLLNAIRQPFRIDGKEVKVGASLGLSLCPSHGTTVAELMIHSDTAMYVAKREGRNNCQAFTTKMAEEIQERIELHNDLEEALENKCFKFLFQPQINVDSNRVIAYEALVRWQHPVRGMVPADVFVPFAEESGLVTRITEMALDESLKVIAKMRKIDPRIFGSINVSAVDFADLPTLVSRIENALETHNLPGDALELELTERIFLEYSVDARKAIETWKKNNVRLAIDDFGTGYSSLKYLLDLQIDTLKIDQSFIRNLHTNARQRSIVETILKMATSLGATCVAEGVESADELNCLREIGCQIYQGHFGSLPLPVNKAIELLE